MNFENIIRGYIRNIFNFLGYNVTRKLINPIIFNKINLVFDVGANAGQYVKNLRRDGYRGDVVSFEPLTSAYKLLTNASGGDANWTVHKRCALGAQDGVAIINIARNSCSSSLLPMLERHSSVASDSITIGQEETEVITLDSIFDDYANNVSNVFLKIDTQGFEHDVLFGSRTSLGKILMVELELSSTHLYGNQKLADFYFSFFAEHGFRLWSLTPIFFDFKTGEVLQFDATFINTRLQPSL